MIMEDRVLQIALSVDADLVKIWDKIKKHQKSGKLKLSGANRKYVIAYTGDHGTAMEIMSTLCGEPGFEILKYELDPFTTYTPFYWSSH